MEQNNKEKGQQYFNYLQEIGILEPEQKEKLIQVSQQTNKKIVFVIADYFKSLTPSDCYDISDRLYNLYCKKQTQVHSQQIIKQEEQKIITNNEQQIINNNKAEEINNQQIPQQQQQGNQQKQKQIADQSFGSLKQKPPIYLQPQIDKNAQKMNQNNIKLDEKKIITIATNQQQDEAPQEQKKEQIQLNNPFVKECMKKLVSLIQKNNKVVLRISLNNIIEYVLQKLESQEQKQQINQEQYDQINQQMEDQIQIAPSQEQLYQEGDQSIQRNKKQQFCFDNSINSNQQLQQQQQQESTQNYNYQQQSQQQQYQHFSSSQQLQFNQKQFQSEAAFSATIDQQQMCLGSVNENNHNNSGSGSNKKSNKQNKTFETAHNSIDEFQLELNNNAVDQEQQQQQNYYSSGAVGGGQVGNLYKYQQQQQQTAINKNQNPFINNNNTYKKFNAKELIESIKNDLKKETSVVESVTSPNFVSLNQKKKCPPSAQLNSSTVEQQMQQPPSNLKQSFQNIHERLAQDQISSNEAKTQLDVLKNKIQLQNCTFKPKTSLFQSGTLNQSRISNASGSQESNKKNQEDDLLLIQQLQQPQPQQQQQQQQSNYQQQTHPKNYQMDSSAFFSSSNINSDQKNQLELKDCTFRPLLLQCSNNGSNQASQKQLMTVDYFQQEKLNCNSIIPSPKQQPNQCAPVGQKQQQQQQQQVTVFERLSRTNSKEKEQAFNLLKQHLEVKDCTFQPKLIQSNTMKSSNSKKNLAMTGSNFEQQQQQLQINANSSFRSGSQDCLNSASSQNSANKHIIFEKLHQEANTRKQLQNQNQQLRDSLIMKDCTFQPATLSSQRSSNNSNNGRNYDVFNKLYSDNERKLRHVKQLKSEKENLDLEQCTFQPKLVALQDSFSRSSEKSRSNGNLLSQKKGGGNGVLTNNININNQEQLSSSKRSSNSPHLRLYEQAKELQEKKKQAEKQKDLEEINQFYKGKKHRNSVHSSQDQNANNNNNNTSFEFLNRMKSFLRKKQDNIEDLAKQTMQECTFSPQTNKKARQLKKSQSNVALQELSILASSQNGNFSNNATRKDASAHSESQRSNNEFYKQLVSKCNTKQSGGKQQQSNNNNTQSTKLQSQAGGSYNFDGKSLLSKLMSLAPLSNYNQGQSNNNNNNNNLSVESNNIVQKQQQKNLNDSNYCEETNKYYLKGSSDNQRDQQTRIMNALEGGTNNNNNDNDQSLQEQQYYHSSDMNFMRNQLSPCDDISELSIAETNQL